ncbi:MAG TPA: FKBP-type peptidyl-prolyl cis-trans isomerase [Ilumatobacter sp.]
MRSHLLATTALALVLAACGGDDNAAAPPPTTPAAPTTLAAASTTATLPTVTGECEAEPDPETYTPGAIPPAIRPCEVPTELAARTIRAGTGREAQPGDTLFVDYTGIRSLDGTVVDNSYTRGRPLEFVIGRGSVITGWDIGLVGARAGSLVRLDIPGELAYGDHPPGDVVQPGDALSFVVEIRAVIPPTDLADAPLGLEIEPSVGATEVMIRDLEVGDGAPIELGDTAIVHLLFVRGDNRVVLLNSWENQTPLQIPVEEGQDLPGVVLALQGANIGTLREIIVPPDQGFGADGEPSMGLPGGVDLIVVVRVLGAI